MLTSRPNFILLHFYFVASYISLTKQPGIWSCKDPKLLLSFFGDVCHSGSNLLCSPVRIVLYCIVNIGFCKSVAVIFFSDVILVSNLLSSPVLSSRKRSFFA
jgi:hypothetical protein